MAQPAVGDRIEAHVWRISAVVIVGAIMSILDTTIVNVALATLGPVLGPTLGGLIVDNASWRWIFSVNLPIGAIAVMLALRFLPARARGDRGHDPLDFVGLALMSTGIPLLTYGLAEIGVTGG